MRARTLKGVFAAAVLAAVSASAADGRDGASAFFAVDGSMEANGWREVRAQRQDSFTVSGGVLTAVCSPNPYKGVSYVRDIDLPEKGELSFEVKQACGNSNRYYLQICAGNLMLSFCESSLLRYFPVPKPNWRNVAEHRIPPGTWTRVRVVWDAAARRIKYYAGDMVVPAAVEENAVIGPDENSSRCTLRLGNYGLASAFQTHQLRGLSVGPPSQEVRAGDGIALVFHGLGSEFFPVESWTKGFAPESIVDFYLSFRGSNYKSGNELGLSGYPDEDLCRAAKLIVLADMPLESRVLPYSVQSNLLAAVESGSRMIVTGGLVGLEKCGDYDSPIAKALPVKLKSPWTSPAGGPVVKVSHGRGKIAVINKIKAERR